MLINPINQWTDTKIIYRTEKVVVVDSYDVCSVVADINNYHM